MKQILETSPGYLAFALAYCAFVIIMVGVIFSLFKPKK